MRALILLAACLAVASTAGAARVSRARRLQEIAISWPRCICDNYRGANPYYVTYLGEQAVPIRVDAKNETNSRFVHRLQINTLPYTENPGVECWDILLQELHKVMFDVSPDCKASFNSAGNTVTVNGSKWSNFQYVIDRPDVPLAEFKVVGLQNFSYAAIKKPFVIEIGTVNTTCTQPAVFFKDLQKRVSFMDRAQNCCGDPKQDFFFPPPPPPRPIGFPHPGCGLDKMNEIPFKLEWVPPKNGNPCFKIAQRDSCNGPCCAMRVQKIEFLQKPVCSVNNPGRAPLKFKSYEDTGLPLNVGDNSTSFTGLSLAGQQTSTNPEYGVVKANNLNWGYLQAADRVICLLMDTKAGGTPAVDCSKINNNFYIPFDQYYGIPYSIFDSTSSAGCCGNGFLFPKDGFWPTGEPAPVPIIVN